MTFTATMKVEEKHLACNVGSGDLPVLATPMMIALMENAAMMAVAPALTDEESTVGGQMNASHTRPTALGDDVRAVATLTAIDRRKLTFSVEAFDSKGSIGTATHLRFIVNRTKFMTSVGE